MSPSRLIKWLALTHFTLSLKGISYNLIHTYRVGKINDWLFHYAFSNINFFVKCFINNTCLKYILIQLWSYTSNSFINGKCLPYKQSLLSNQSAKSGLVSVKIYLTSFIKLNKRVKTCLIEHHPLPTDRLYSQPSHGTRLCLRFALSKDTGIPLCRKCFFGSFWSMEKIRSF